MGKTKRCLSYYKKKLSQHEVYIYNLDTVSCRILSFQNAKNKVHVTDSMKCLPEQRMLEKPQQPVSPFGFLCNSTNYYPRKCLDIHRSYMEALLSSTSAANMNWTADDRIREKLSQCRLVPWCYKLLFPERHSGSNKIWGGWQNGRLLLCVVQESRMRSCSQNAAAVCLEKQQQNRQRQPPVGNSSLHSRKKAALTIQNCMNTNYYQLDKNTCACGQSLKLKSP